MDIHFNLVLSTLNSSLPTNQQVLLRFLSSFSGEEGFSPIVQRIRELKNRNESLNKDFLKYIKKTRDSFNELSKELDSIEDDHPILLAQLKEEVNSNQKLIHSSLSKIEPIIKVQIEAIKKLSDHISPPTEELFRKKALAILEKNKVQQVPISKKNRCTICLDSDSDIIIKRTCKPPPPTSTSTSSSIGNTSNNTTSVGNSTSTTNRNNPTSPPTTTTTTATTLNSSPSANSFFNLLNNATLTGGGRAARTSSLQQPQPQPQQIQIPEPRKTAFCENAVCNCGPVTCRDCIIKFYWESTSNGLKSYSKCCCCRAEFCIKDIYSVEYIDDKVTSDNKQPIQVNDIKPNTSTTTTTTTTTTNTISPTSKKRKDDSESPKDNKRYKEQQQQQQHKDESNNNNNKNSNSKSTQKPKNSLDDDTEKNKLNGNNRKKKDENDEDGNSRPPSNSSNSFKKLISFWK